MTGWVRADEAAVLLGTTVGNVHVIAHRRSWERRGVGRTVRYRLTDAMGEVERRSADEGCARPREGGRS